MHLLTVTTLAVLWVAAATAQQLPAPRPCPHEAQTPVEKSSRLQRILRQKGFEALVDEIVRPQRLLWDQFQEALRKPDGMMYFSLSAQGAMLGEMIGYLISQSDTELLLGMSSPDTPELTLKLAAPAGRDLEPGTRVLFEGRARDFTPVPFMVAVEVDPTAISFLPPAKQPSAAQ